MPQKNAKNTTVRGRPTQSLLIPCKSSQAIVGGPGGGSGTEGERGDGTEQTGTGSVPDRASGRGATIHTSRNASGNRDRGRGGTASAAATGRGRCYETLNVF